MSGLEGYAPPAAAAKPLKPTELLASLRNALEPWTPGTPFWIFAYGSLMWNPSFSWDARHGSTIRGYHRSFRLLSRAPDLVQEQMQLIWKREMLYGSYRPKWLNCSVGDESIRALAFTVNRGCSGYTGPIPLEVMVEAIASAAGRYGPAYDYLFKTTETLKEHGIRDSRVEHLASLVRARISSTKAA